jgi:hypothetical protein
VQSYKIHANYTPRQWMNLDGAIDIQENRDNVYQVNSIEHGRSYSFVTVLSPNPKLSFDLGYTYTDIYSQARRYASRRPARASLRIQPARSQAPRFRSERSLFIAAASILHMAT